MAEIIFKNKIVKLVRASLKNVGVSRSSLNLASIISDLKEMTILDIGCGIGYMSIGALLSGAKKVVATDICNVEKQLRDNLKLNNIKQNKLTFYRSYLFDNIPSNLKFDVIIANLPQHALPANIKAKRLKGKYGGYDGTDLVSRCLTEAFSYLKPDGRYFGSISKLTNYKRTLGIAKSLYEIKLKKVVQKNIDLKEMLPYVSEEDFLNHLERLKRNRLINFSVNGKNIPIKYQVNYCQFNKKALID